jgi:hypothetical protein
VRVDSFGIGTNESERDGSSASIISVTESSSFRKHRLQRVHAFNVTVAAINACNNSNQCAEDDYANNHSGRMLPTP